MTKKKGSAPPSQCQASEKSSAEKNQFGTRPPLARDHTVRFTSWSVVDGTEFHNLVFDHLSDLRCVQIIDGKTFDVTFCSVGSAQKMVASPTCCLGTSTFLVSPVDRPRQLVKVQGLPFEISQADVIEVLSQYGEVFSAERLKYMNRSYDNGDRAFIMHLESNIPRYVEVYGYEGIVFHRRQELSCNYCHMSGHVRQRCPDLVCRLCGDCGHFSYSCPRRVCKKCHGAGHWARECPVHPVPVQPTVSVPAVLRESVIKRPRVDPSTVSTPPSVKEPVCPPKSMTSDKPPMEPPMEQQMTTDEVPLSPEEIVALYHECGLPSPDDVLSVPASSIEFLKSTLEKRKRFGT